MTIYNGIFLRDYQGQQPNFSGTGGQWDQSPDVVTTGPRVQDATQFVTPTGYGTSYPNVLGLNQANFVWVRAVNTTQTAMTGRIWLFWAQSSLFMYPTAWQSAGISVGGNNYVNFQPITVAAAPPPPSPPPFPPKAPPVSVPAVTAMPFLVTPAPAAAGSDNFALIALLENVPSTPPMPPLPTYFQSLGDLATWVANTPTVGWLDTAFPTTPAPVLQSTITVNSGAGGKFSVQAAGYGLPTDGTIGCECAGPDFANSVDLYQQPVTSANPTISKTVTWPPSFTTSITVSFWKGATNPSSGAALRAVLIPVT